MRTTTSRWLALAMAGLFAALSACSSPPAAQYTIDTRSEPSNRVLAGVGSDPRGTLLIGGGGGLRADVYQRFRQLVVADGPLVVIPTASDRADEADAVEVLTSMWQRRGFDEVIVLHTRDRAEAESPEFAEPIRRAAAVWFGGGRQARLAMTYLDTPVEEEIHALLARGGVVGGSSAGAAIMSRRMIVGGVRLARTAEGLDLIRGSVIDQHFSERSRQERLRGVIREHPHLLGVGIDERTALIVRGASAEVIGLGRVHLFESRGGDAIETRSAGPGDRIDLGRRRVLQTAG
ncbi:MAG: cyanophycinase [Phycisphaerales bacterium]|nr:cyanophycinase [Planctomycetota bacterium]MCH8509352.1 cyanophycinase [Phycisphaerales bacterium]